MKQKQFYETPNAELFEVDLKESIIATSGVGGTEQGDIEDEDWD